MAAPVLRRQSGAALLSVLLVTALAVSLAAAMAAASWIDLRRSANLLDSRQAWYYALGGETLARQMLVTSLRDQPEIDHPGQAWARDALSFELDEGVLALSISDLQGRFNLNNLVDAQGRVRSAELVRLRSLFEVLGLDPAPLSTLQEWLLQEQARRSQQQQPGAAPQWPFADTSVLVPRAGLDYANYLRLAPHLSALPGNTPLNVNTATEPVLRALSPIMSGSRLATVLRRQQAGGYSTVQAFTQDTGIGGGGALLAVTSDYFEVRTEVRFAGRRSELLSVLRRQRGERPEFEVLGRQRPAPQREDSRRDA